jgi:hypothetical protein
VRVLLVSSSQKTLMGLRGAVTYPGERAKHDPAKREHVGGEVASGAFRGLLRVDVKPCMSTETPQEEHDDKNQHPGISFVHVHQAVPNEAGNQTANRDENDTDDERERARVDCRKRLSSQNDGGDGEAKPFFRRSSGETKSEASCRAKESSLCQDVQDGVYRASSITRAEPCDDHRAKTCLRSQGRNERRRGCTKGTKAKDGGNSMAALAVNDRCVIVFEHTHGNVNVKISWANTPIGIVVNTQLTDLRV